MSDLVSAIIPTYNYGRFVARAIESVLQQTHGRVECVVVDDGSTDDTSAVLEPFRDRIRAISQPNSGLSAARNTGIQAASGQFIALLDADDYWLPRKIELQVSLLAERPDVGAVGCGRRHVTAEGKVTAEIVARDSTGRWEDDVRAVALRRLWVGGSGSGLLARREVFDSVGLFDTSLKAAEDWDMWLRIVSRFPIANVPDLLVDIQQHGTGVFRNPTRMEENQFKVYEKAVAEWPDALNEGIRRQMRSMILSDSAGEYVTAGDFRMAARKYAASLREWPLDRRRWLKLARVLLKR